MSDKLKKANNQLPGIEDVWAAHKLRNRVAHEPGFQPKPRDVEHAMTSIERVLQKFI